MDPITHMLTGALVDQNLAKKDFVKQATWIGVLSAAAPDLDYFFRSDNNPLFHLEIHRSFSHSLIFILVGGLLMTGFFLLLFKSCRPRWKEIFCLSTVAYGTHSLLDTCTSYGTELFWPFSRVRISWDIISIIDPLFTLILFIGVIITYRMNIFRAARWALIIAFCYLGFTVFQHHRAMEMQARLQIQRHHIQSEQSRVLPRLGSQYHWDSLYVYQGMVYLDAIHTPLGNEAQGEKNFSVPLFSAGNNIKSNMGSIESFVWFTQNYTTSLSENPLILIDLRYLDKKTVPVALWGIQWNFQDRKHPMKWMSSVPIK